MAKAKALKVEAQARVKVLEEVGAAAWAIELAGMEALVKEEAVAAAKALADAEAAAAAKALEDAEANARAKALEEAEAAMAKAHADEELAAVAKALEDEGEAILKATLDKEVFKRRLDEAAAESEAKKKSVRLTIPTLEKFGFLAKAY